MQDAVLIRTGHGYESGDRGRCEAFDGIEIIANPLGGWDNASRESRVFRGASATGCGVCYGSHMLAIGQWAGERGERGGPRGDLLLMVHHGAGREVWRIRAFFDGGALKAHILAMPERVQYALLYTLYSTASDSRRQGMEETRREWAQAAIDGRIRKGRAVGGRVKVNVESAQEQAWRLAKRQRGAA